VVVGMKIAYFVNLSTITRILSNPLERGKIHGNYFEGLRWDGNRLE
jgi:hypothetical protein